MHVQHVRLQRVHSASAKPARTQAEDVEIHGGRCVLEAELILVSYSKLKCSRWFVNVLIDLCPQMGPIRRSVT